MTKHAWPLVVVMLLLTACGEKKEDADMVKPHEAPPPEVVRPSALAGRGWYPGDASELKRTVDGYLEGEAWEGGPPRALIVPHAGYTWSGAMQGRAYGTIRGGDYRRVFILGVPHRARVSGVSIPAVTHYETPLGKVPLDREAADRLLASGPPFTTHRFAHDQEHSVEIQLPFLQRALTDFRIVPMLVHTDATTVHTVAKALRAELRPGDLLVASSDNTHYGDRFDYWPFPADENAAENLKRLDMDAVEKILALDLHGYTDYKEKTDITTCGYCGICVLLATLPPAAKGAVTGYDTSASKSGDFRSVVSYVGIAFTGPDWGAPAVEDRGLSVEEQQLSLRLARASMERYVRDGEQLDASAEGWDLTPALLRRSGVFVTLKIKGRLRGCIGDTFPVRPLHEAISARAVSAAMADPRFREVSEEELEDIRVELSVLSPPRDIPSAQDIVLGEHGIVFLHDGRIRSLYLPQVAPEQGWDLDQTLSSLSRKGGLAPDAWRSEKASFQVFTAQVFGEDE